MRVATRMGLLASLYLSQGLPFGFFQQALPVLMRRDGASLGSIGLSSLLFLPWALKWMWGPWVDAYGRRKAWIIPLQLCSIVTALGLAQAEGQVFWLKVAIVLTALFAATQDVPTDALAVQLLPAQQRGMGNAVQVGAYRLGMVLGGGLLLWTLEAYGWRMAFTGMAVLLAVGLIPTVRYSEPPRPPRAVLSAGEGVGAKLRWVRKRLRRPGMRSLVLLMMGYKLGDAMASAMVKPLLVDSGWTMGKIAQWSGAAGSVAGLAGAVIGGLLADRLPRRQILAIAGWGQTFAVALYAVATLMPGAAWLPSALIAEHIWGGMATVALFTLMMDAAEPEHAGVDYSLQAAAVVIVTGLGGMAAGFLADAIGFTAMFVVSALLSGIGCWALCRAMNGPTFGALLPARM